MLIQSITLSCCLSTQLNKEGNISDSLWWPGSLIWGHGSQQRYSKLWVTELFLEAWRHLTFHPARIQITRCNTLSKIPFQIFRWRLGSWIHGSWWSYYRKLWLTWRHLSFHPTGFRLQDQNTSPMFIWQMQLPWPWRCPVVNYSRLSVTTGKFKSVMLVNSTLWVTKLFWRLEWVSD